MLGWMCDCICEDGLRNTINIWPFKAGILLILTRYNCTTQIKKLAELILFTQCLLSFGKKILFLLKQCQTWYANWHHSAVDLFGQDRSPSTILIPVIIHRSVQFNRNSIQTMFRHAHVKCKKKQGYIDIWLTLTSVFQITSQTYTVLFVHRHTWYQSSFHCKKKQKKQALWWVVAKQDMVRPW